MIGLGLDLMNSPAAYLLLSSMRVVSQRPLQGLFVEGSQDGAVFRPTGNVQGQGELGEAGSSGWLELASGTFQPDRTGRPPFPPYVKGYLTPQGEFRPSSRSVIY